MLINKMSFYTAGIYLLEFNNRNTRTRCEICSKLTRKIPERRQWRRSGVFIVKFEHISSVYTVNFEHVIAGWVLTVQVTVTNMKNYNRDWQIINKNIHAEGIIIQNVINKAAETNRVA